MSGRVWQVGGVAAVGGIGYYLYSAGGNPKLAEKKMEGTRFLNTTFLYLHLTDNAASQPMPPSSVPT